MTSYSFIKNSIFCDILTENIAVDYPMHFIGDANSAPETKPYYPGVFSDDGESFYHIKPDGKRMSLRNETSAEMFSNVLRKSYVKKLNELGNKLDIHYQSAYHSPQNVVTLNRYTSIDDQINHKMLSGNLNQNDRNYVTSLNSLMHSHQTPEPLVVYSGMSKGHSLIIRNREIVNHPSFISTSLSPNSASDFASKYDGDMMEIHVPSGHPGIWAHPVSKHHEHEFLLPSGLNLRIHHDKEKVMITPTKRFRVHYATIEG